VKHSKVRNSGSAQ